LRDKKLDAADWLIHETIKTYGLSRAAGAVTSSH